MFNVRFAGDYLYRKWLFTWLSLVKSLMVLILCCPFTHEMSWIISGTELSQFMTIFLPTLHCLLTGFSMKKCHLLKINEVYEHFNWYNELS